MPIRTPIAQALLLAAATLAAPAQQPAQAPGKRPMTFADLMAMKRVSDPQISPSGKWVLFSVTDVSLQANTRTNHLWVVPLDGSAPERQLTQGKGESNGRFSPDGHQISFTADDPQGTSQIFLAPWNDGNASLATAKELTHLSSGADGAIWSPDSQHLLLTSPVYPECSSAEGARAAADALRTPATTLAERVGGAGKPATLLNQSLHPAAWSDEAACNKLRDDAAQNSKVKAQIWESLLYRHWNHFTGQKRSHILLVSSTNGSNLRDLTPATSVGDAETPTFSLGGPLGYAWSPDSREIAYVTNLDPVPATSTNNDIFTLRVDAATDNEQSLTATKPVKISTSPGSDDGPQYSPDGKYIAFRSQARAGFESDQFRLVIYDRGTARTNILMNKPVAAALPLLGAPAFQGWIDEFSWSVDSKYLYFASGDRGEEPLFQISVTGNDFRRLGKVLGEWSEIHESPNGILIGTLVRVNRPAELASARSFQIDDSARTFAVDLSKSGPVPETTTPTLEPHCLSHLNETILAGLALPPLESFWFAGAGGTKVEGFLVHPPNFDPNKKYPLKFLIHGGPQGAWGDSWSYRWNPELMAASGYVVVMINPRGSTGYGQKFVDEVSGDWGGRPYQDLMLGLDYAELHFPFIDKTRECALGASYGGYMADWILTHTDRFKCIVTHDGMSDPASAYGTTEELWFPQWEFRSLVGGDGLSTAAPNSKGIGGVTPGPQNGQSGTVEQPRPSHPWDFYSKPADQDPYRRWSPMLAIQNARTPTLVIHSQLDYRLDISQGLELFTALQLRGIASKFLYFPDEGHWVLKPQNSELWNATVSDWCDRWTHTNHYAMEASDNTSHQK